MLFHFIKPIISDQVARLISPTMRHAVGAAPQDCMLRLHYHMWGSGIRSLSIYTRTQDGGPLNRVGGIIGNKGSGWERMEVPFNNVAGRPFQVGICIDIFAYRFDNAELIMNIQNFLKIFN